MTDSDEEECCAACGDPSDTVCDNADICDGSGTCLDNSESSGTACGDQGVTCVIDDTCDGAGACTDNGFEDDGTPCGNPLVCFMGSCEEDGAEPIGGTFIQPDKTALLLAGAQSISMWMIPVVVSGVGIGVFVVLRKK